MQCFPVTCGSLSVLFEGFIGLSLPEVGFDPLWVNLPGESADRENLLVTLEFLETGSLIRIVGGVGGVEGDGFVVFFEGEVVLFVFEESISFVLELERFLLVLDLLFSFLDGLVEGDGGMGSEKVDNLREIVLVGCLESGFVGELVVGVGPVLDEFLDVFQVAFFRRYQEGRMALVIFDIWIRLVGEEKIHEGCVALVYGHQEGVRDIALDLEVKVRPFFDEVFDHLSLLVSSSPSDWCTEAGNFIDICSFLQEIVDDADISLHGSQVNTCYIIIPGNSKKIYK